MGLVRESTCLSPFFCCRSTVVHIFWAAPCRPSFLNTSLEAEIWKRLPMTPKCSSSVILKKQRCSAAGNMLLRGRISLTPSTPLDSSLQDLSQSMTTIITRASLKNNPTRQLGTYLSRVSLAHSPVHVICQYIYFLRKLVLILMVLLQK